MIRAFFAARQNGAARALLLASVCAAFVATATAATAKATYVTFEVAGARQTLPIAVNREAEVAGEWDDGQTFRGFVRAVDGTISTFNPPGSVFTTIRGISDTGLVVGWYLDAAYFAHGFLHTPDGATTVYDAAGNETGATEINAVNSKGTFTGSYTDINGNGLGFFQNSKGRFQSFSIEGAINIQPLSVNTAGTIAGRCEDDSFVWHGFTRSPDGTVSTFDLPGPIGDYGFAINSNNVIVGHYVANSQTHGFARAADGTITTIDDPDGAMGTSASNINDRNEIIGTFTSADGHIHGFVLPASGSFKNFDPKNSMSTDAYGINRKGLITGDYNDGSSHGYLRLPSGGR